MAHNISLYDFRITPDELTRIIEDELDNSVPTTYAHVVSDQTRGADKYGKNRVKNSKTFEETKFDEYKRKEAESILKAKKLAEEEENRIKLNMDKDLDMALKYQIEEACKRSKEMEVQRQQEIAMAVAEKERLRRRDKAFKYMKTGIYEEINNSFGTPNHFKKIATYIDDFERETSSEFFARRDITTLNGRSALILEVIKLFRNDNEINVRKIINFYKFHILDINQSIGNILRHNLAKYVPDEHVLDSNNQFTHNLLHDKFKTIDVKGDGNCLWNCVSIAVSSNYSTMETLRVLTANILLNNESYFREYLSDQRKKYGYNHELTFDQLVDASTELQVWGDELHILALSMALERPIFSYGSSISIGYENFQTYEKLLEYYEQTPLNNQFRYLANEKHVRNNPILLYYNGENHYNVVLPTNDKYRAPVPCTQILEPIFKVVAEINQDKKNEFTRDSIVRETSFTTNQQQREVSTSEQDDNDNVQHNLAATNNEEELPKSSQASRNPRFNHIYTLLDRTGYTIIKKIELDALKGEIVSLKIHINHLQEKRKAERLQFDKLTDQISNRSNHLLTSDESSNENLSNDQDRNCNEYMEVDEDNCSRVTQL